MKVTATDAAGNVSDFSSVWNVQVDSIAPTFTSAPTLSINENTPAGTVIHTATATDVSPVTYTITGGADAALFLINSANGAVFMQFKPDY